MENFFRYLSELFFQKPFQMELLERDLCFAQPLVYRFEIQDIKFISKAQDDWLQRCVTLATQDIMQWMAREMDLEDFFNRETGIVFPSVGVILLVPNADTDIVLEHASSFYGSAIISFIAVRLQQHLHNNIETYPGSADEFVELFGPKGVPKYQLTGQWFQMSSESAEEDLFEYLHLIQESYVDDYSQDDADAPTVWTIVKRDPINRDDENAFRSLTTTALYESLCRRFLPHYDLYPASSTPNSDNANFAILNEEDENSGESNPQE